MKGPRFEEANSPLSATTTEPIYQVGLLWYKVYVIKTDLLANAIHRQPRSFSFYPFAIGVMSSLLGIPVDTQKTLLSNMYTTGFMKEWHDIFKRTMLPGQTLHQFTEAAVNELADQLGNVETKVESLRGWLDILAIRVGTKALWGDKSPFRADPSLEQSFR